jgi:aldehyde dehydrogenase (NAD+)
VIDHRTLFLGGAWRAPRSPYLIDVHSANTEQLIGRVPEAGPSDVDTAVTAARDAYDSPGGWAGWAAAERTEVLHRFADAVDKRVAELAALVSDQNGMPIGLATLSDARRPGQLLRYYADLAESTPTDEVRHSYTGGSTLVRRVPRGVVGAVVPWNFPNTLAAMKYAPALAAGCTVVLKPAAETVLDTILLADAAMEAGLPAGVLNIVPGGRDTGAYLVGHPGVDAVAFTGSTVAGRVVAQVCGRLLRPATLELGGRSAAVVLDDADLAAAVPQLAGALFGNNGQTCFSSSRVLAPRGRYDEVVTAIADLARSLRVGSSLDPDTRIGPLVSARQRDRVEGHIALGRAAGARLVTGGGRPPGQHTGWFVEPTVFADVDNTTAVGREEIFGPVVTITPYDGLDEAVALANDSDYGLAGTVWTTDRARGLAVAARLETGSVGINGYQPDLHSPLAGTRASGLGVKLGPEGLASYQRFQSVYS